MIRSGFLSCAKRLELEVCVRSQREDHGVVRNDVVTHRSACKKAKLRFVGCFTRGNAAM